MKKPLRTLFYGQTHEHAPGKLETLKKRRIFRCRSATCTGRIQRSVLSGISSAPAFLAITCMSDPLRKRKQMTIGDDAVAMAFERGYAMVGYWGEDFLPDMSLDPAERKGWERQVCLR